MLKRRKDLKAELPDEQIVLRQLELSDVTNRYVEWMNDRQVTQFLESRFVKQTFDSVKDFVEGALANPAMEFFAIEDRATGTHLGNIQLGPINWNHKTADLGLMIGERTFWGKGYGTQAIRLVTEYAFAKLGLCKVTAGAYANNPGSIRAFEKAGWQVEGTRPNAFQSGNERVDHVLLGLSRPKDKD
jgi:ribosomal-protein-alanine N-acetyltransferase